MTQNITPITQLSALPAKPSALLRTAIADAKKIFNTPGYKLNMLEWHGTYSGVCEVCFAGAVMAGTLGAEKDRFCSPSFFGADDSKLQALDAIRHGHVHSFVTRTIGRGLTADETETLYAEIPTGFSEVAQPKVGTKGVGFLRDMAKIAAKLESIGW